MADIVFPGMSASGPIGQDYLPANYDLVLYKGDYLPFAVTLKDSANQPIDLTGYTAKCSLRANYEAADAFDADCTITAAEGKVDIVFPSSLTSHCLLALIFGIFRLPILMVTPEHILLEMSQFMQRFLDDNPRRTNSD